MIILDTHTWIWFVSARAKLSSAASDACESAKRLLVSAISVWEVAMLVSKERIGFDRDVEIWTREALSIPKISLEPLTPSIAVRSTRLPGNFHGDPADRIIAATALEHGVPLVTKDSLLQRYAHIRTVW